MPRSLAALLLAACQFQPRKLAASLLEAFAIFCARSVRVCSELHEAMREGAAHARAHNCNVLRQHVTCRKRETRGYCRAQPTANPRRQKAPLRRSARAYFCLSTSALRGGRGWAPQKQTRLRQPTSSCHQAAANQEE